MQIRAVPVLVLIVGLCCGRAAASQLRGDRPWHPRLARVNYDGATWVFDKRVPAVNFDGDPVKTLAPLLLQVGLHQQRGQCNCSRGESAQPFFPTSKGSGRHAAGGGDTQQNQLATLARAATEEQKQLAQLAQVTQEQMEAAQLAQAQQQAKAAEVAEAAQRQLEALRRQQELQAAVLSKTARQQQQAEELQKAAQQQLQAAKAAQQELENARKLQASQLAKKEEEMKQEVREHLQQEMRRQLQEQVQRQVQEQLQKQKEKLETARREKQREQQEELKQQQEAQMRMLMQQQEAVVMFGQPQLRRPWAGGPGSWQGSPGLGWAPADTMQWMPQSTPMGFTPGGAGPWAAAGFYPGQAQWAGEPVMQPAMEYRPYPPMMMGR